MQNPLTNLTSFDSSELGVIALKNFEQKGNPVLSARNAGRWN